jgi:hypothetical protein
LGNNNDLIVIPLAPPAFLPTAGGIYDLSRKAGFRTTTAVLNKGGTEFVILR